MYRPFQQFDFLTNLLAQWVVHLGSIASSKHRARKYVNAMIIVFVVIQQPLNRLNAQAQNQGNQRLAQAGGAANLIDTFRELVPMVMVGTSSLGEDGRQGFQLGVINALPSYISMASLQYVGKYKRQSDAVGQTYNAGPNYRSQTVNFAQPLTVDPDNMVLKSSSWFHYKGLVGSKPPVETGFGYDSNQSNAIIEQSDPVIVQTSSITLPFSYGTAPGSSWLVLFSYQPSYRMVLSGPGENELNHQVDFSAGRQIDASAYGFNNTTRFSSMPVRELSGRQRIFSNRTTILTVHDVSPKSLLHAGFGHSISVRDSGLPGSNPETLTTDEVLLRYDYNFKPRLTLGPDVRIGMNSVGGGRIFTESAQLSATYGLSPKTILSLAGGLQYSHASDQPGEFSKNYGVLLAYSPTPKTTMGLEFSRAIRPSFVNQGIFLTEDTILYEIEKAIFLRWILRLDVDYTVRSEALSNGVSGLEQEDFGISAQATYFMSNRTIFEFGFSRFRLDDLIENTKATRLGIECSVSHAF